MLPSIFYLQYHRCHTHGVEVITPQGFHATPAAGCAELVAGIDVYACGSPRSVCLTTESEHEVPPP